MNHFVMENVKVLSPNSQFVRWVIYIKTVWLKGDSRLPCSTLECCEKMLYCCCLLNQARTKSIYTEDYTDWDYMASYIHELEGLYIHTRGVLHSRIRCFISRKPAWRLASLTGWRTRGSRRWADDEELAGDLFDGWSRYEVNKMHRIAGHVPLVTAEKKSGVAE